MMPGHRWESPLANDVAPSLARALARICEAEGVFLEMVRSIEVDEDEISVRIDRPTGDTRVVIYP